MFWLKPEWFCYIIRWLKPTAMKLKILSNILLDKNQAVNYRAPSTHPDIATLVDPLFACGGKRVKHLFLK
jgi:hypothetical protein